METTDRPSRRASRCPRLLLCVASVLGLMPMLSAAPAAEQAAPPPAVQWVLAPANLAGEAFKPSAAGATPLGQMPATAAIKPAFTDDAPPALKTGSFRLGKKQVSQYLTVADDASAAGLPAAAITVEAWAMVESRDSLGGFASALADTADPPTGWAIGYADGHFRFSVAAGKARAITNVTDRDGTHRGFWCHVVGTYDGREQRLYVDGRLVAASDAQAGPIAYSPKTPLLLGALRSGGKVYPHSGRLERVTIWPRALSAAQVRALFDTNKKRFPDAQPVPPVAVADWPTYRRDNRRSAATPQPLDLPLTLLWVHRPAHAPAPAWPDPAKADYFHNKPKLEPRVIYDRAPQPVAVAGRVLFGSSSEDKIVCLDASTGRVCWQFFTEGPVRLAPAIANGRAVVGCDDGTLYCLDVQTGERLWSHRPAVADFRIAGNQRIVSLYPYRTGPIIDGQNVLAVAGLFPLQGVFQEKLDLATGKLVESQPLTISPQGYPSLILGQFATPTGRSPRDAVLTKAARRGKISAPASARPAAPFAAIRAGNVEFGGGRDLVVAYDPNDDNAPPLWQAKVEGRAYGLAAAQGKLLVATNTGAIYCFGKTDDRGAAEAQRAEEETPRAANHKDTKAQREAASFVSSSLAGGPNVVSAADRVIKLAAGQKRGYCLLLGDKSPALAAELAKRSEWQIVCRVPDAKTADQANRALDAAHLRGARVAVHVGPTDKLPYADGLFDVVVNADAVPAAQPGARNPEAVRVTRPGGWAVLGPADRDATQPALPRGVGEWTHTYANLGNTACSGERNVGGKLSLQWFGLPGPREILDRHHRPTPPLAKAGRLFVPGDGVVFGVGAYNGTILWRTELPGFRRLGTFLDCGAMCVDDSHLFVAAPDGCRILDVATGKVQKQFHIPAEAGASLAWEYVARTADLLLGSACLPSAAYRETSKAGEAPLWGDRMKIVTSRALFALHAATGKPRWTYAPRGAVLFNTAIAVGGERVYFVESRAPAAANDPIGRVRLADLAPGSNFLVALDLATGREAWRRPIDLANAWMIAYLDCAGDTLVFSSSRNRDKKVWYYLQTFAAKDGKAGWQASYDSGYRISGGHGEQNRHPVVVGQTIFAWPYQYDLATGKQLADWKFDRHGHGCGNVSASADTLFWRGKNPWRQDLEPAGKPEPMNLVSRPGCFINILPANGMVLIPEGSSGCTCDFPIQASFGYAPAKQD